MAGLTGIGVGPGDPDLLTVKAVRAIQNADVIMCPASAEDRPSIAFSIVSGIIDKSRKQEIVKLVFPMTKDRDVLESVWKRNAKIMAEAVLSGRDVVYLTVGDPYLYSTWIYMHKDIEEKPPTDKTDRNTGNHFRVYVRIQGGRQHCRGRRKGLHHSVML